MNQRDKNSLKPKKASRSIIRDDIIALDKRLLRLLVKRFNLLEKIREKGRLNPDDEKAIRTEWQKEATTVSRDPEVSGTLFSLLQNISFRPQPKNQVEGNIGPGAQRKEDFSLRPPRLPVKISRRAPLSARLTVLWLYLASASGQSVSINPCLENELLASFLKTLTQLGTGINAERDNAAVISGHPLGRPDIVVHCPDLLTFSLLLAHYLGDTSRAKFTSNADFHHQLDPIIAFLPELGCRFTSLIPKTSALPARIECSGLLPECIQFSEQIPFEFCLAFCIADFFYARPVLIDFSRHPEKEEIVEIIQPLLEQCQADYTIKNFTLLPAAKISAIPNHPDIPVEEGISAFLLALAEPLRGNIVLEGTWPYWKKAHNLWKFLVKYCHYKKNNDQLTNINSTVLHEFKIEDPKFSLIELPDFALPLLCALGACAVLSGGTAILPPFFAELDGVENFFTAAGLTINPDGTLYVPENATPQVLNAPTAAWAFALALAACANRGKTPFYLGNPNIIFNWWSAFWRLYNALPEPNAKAAKIPAHNSEKKGRRIHTDSVILPPAIQEEDWD